MKKDAVEPKAPAETPPAPQPEHKSSGKGNKLPLLITIILLVLLLPLGGYFLLNEANKAKVAPVPEETKQQQVANPASVYCEEQGGKEQIITAPDGSADGVCVLSDGKKCNSWDFYRTKACKSSASPSPSEGKQSFLEIPEFGVKFALTDPIKDAYYLNNTVSKGYVYLKVHSLDGEPTCAKDDNSEAALSRVGKDEINVMTNKKYSDTFDGVTIGNYFYYIDLAQYLCAQKPANQTLLDNVRKTFSSASKTITQL